MKSYNQQKTYPLMPHTFNVEVAKTYGVECAIMLSHFALAISYEKYKKQHFNNGRYWTFQPLADLVINFPYWSKQEIKEIIEKLCDGKEFESILIKHDHMSDYYSFSDQLSQNEEE